MRDDLSMRQPHFSGFARCAYRNARRMKELLPIVTDAIEQERVSWEQYEAESDAAYEAELEERRAQGNTKPLHRMRMRFPGPEEHEMEECAATVIVMAHMAIEAYIYDFAGRELGDDAAKDLDSLSPVAKWLFIPRLTRGHEVDKSTEIFARLKQLTTLRNKFAHPKSREVADPVKASEGVDLVKAAQDAISTLEVVRAHAEMFDDTGIPELMLSEHYASIVLSKKTRERIEREIAAEREATLDGGAAPTEK